MNIPKLPKKPITKSCHGISWNDEELDLTIPKSKMIISERDQKLPKLNNVDKKLLPS